MSEKIPIKKTTYNKGKFSKVIDTQFRELNISSSVSDEITIEDFFRIYENLISDISKEGNINSHRYILNREAEYLGVDIEEDEDIQNLLQEITDLREQLVNIKRNSDLLSERMSLGMGGVPSDDYLQENAMEAALFGVNAGLSRISSIKEETNATGGITKDQADKYYHPLSGSLDLDFNADKLKSRTLIIPNAVPVAGEVGKGETALYAISAGFSGQKPSGAGSLSEIAITTSGGISVAVGTGSYGSTGSITGDGGTFSLSIANDALTISQVRGLQGILDGNSGSMHYIQNQTSSAQDADFWIDGKAKAGTLIIPTGAPELQAGETALYSISAGFSGTNPSGSTVINSIWDINGVYPTGTVVTGNVLYYTGTIWTNKTLGSSDIYGLDSLLTGKQAKLVGTGASSLVRVNASGVVDYDNTSYATVSQLSGYATTSSLGNYLPLSGGTMNDTKTISWNSNVVSWDDGSGGFRCISNFNETYSYHAGFSFKGYYGLQLRTFGGSDTFTIRGHNAINWGAWREVIHSGNIGSQSVGNAVTWNGLQIALETYTSGTVHFALVYNSTNRRVEFGDWEQYKTFLGLGASAFHTDTYYALLAGSSSQAFAASTLTMTENINTNLRIPKVAPTSPTSGQYYFYIVE